MNQANIENYLNPESIRQTVAEIGATGYEELGAVLRRAFIQAAHGKGKERHAQNLPFTQQPMQQLISLYGVGFALGQAAKKAQESQRLPVDRAVNELLGAINYLAGAVIALEGNGQPVAKPVPVAANDNQPQTTALDVTTLTDADGWVTYDGTNPPPPGSVIDAIFPSGKIYKNEPAGMFIWGRTAPSEKEKRAKYRIVKMLPPQAPDADGFILFDGTNPPPDHCMIDFKATNGALNPTHYEENISADEIDWHSLSRCTHKYRIVKHAE